MRHARQRMPVGDAAAAALAQSQESVLRLSDTVATLRARVAALTRVARALDDLMDWQNGPPLVTYTEGWTAAMDEARAALADVPKEGT